MGGVGVKFVVVSGHQTPNLLLISASAAC
ncbi:UNVERIFIED_ORG: hypothetical protein J2W66_002903 [Agrobacterium larrymoorei]|nr:hypothetical protein [Agrobacterium larrymoorei]